MLGRQAPARARRPQGALRHWFVLSNVLAEACAALTGVGCFAAESIDLPLCADMRAVETTLTTLREELNRSKVEATESGQSAHKYKVGPNCPVLRLNGLNVD